MMISPEGYYSLEISGKSAAQIRSIIRSLKRQMNRLKNTMEHPDYTSNICPSELTQFQCNRQYLERAIQALAEAGEAYTPTKAEQKSAEFDNSIPYISAIEFSIGGFIGGYEKRTVVVSPGDELCVISEHFPSYDAAKASYSVKKEVFFKDLRNIHIGEWHSKYSLEKFGFLVMDGTQWELSIMFSNGHRAVKISGDNAYPYNFEELAALLLLGSEC